MDYQNRDKYLIALKAQVDENVFKHSLAVEACMADIYDFLRGKTKFHQNEAPLESWLLAGLIHDIDYGGEFKEKHPNKTLEALKKHNLSINEQVHNIVLCHAPELTGKSPNSLAEWSLFCMDSLTGLITAVALIYPSKKIADVKTSSVIKRLLKEPRFAAGTRRKEIAMCENADGLNIPLEKFVEICLKAMQRISKELGL